MTTIAVIVGSLRQDSINLKLAKALAKLAAGLEQPLNFEFLNIAALPLYNEDLWSSPPQAVLDFKAAVKNADGVLLVSPEYNRSITAPLKNALDWGSRPFGDSVWPKKPVGIVGASPGKAGAIVAQTLLRSILVGLDTRLLAQPEVFLQFEKEVFADNDDVVNERTREFLNKYVKALAQWVAEHSA
jgi:chromate reductase